MPANAPEAAPRFYLCSYWPLCKTAGGRQAALKYGLPPYVNGLARREPDFEHRAPAITASSRGRNFAPRLRPGDAVVYVTTKGRWGEVRFPHWRFVAVLEVTRRFETHAEAAGWYRRHRMDPPSNLVVDGNPPLPVALTLHHGRLHDDAWDAVCIERAAACGTLLVCEPRFLALYDPPVVTEGDLLARFGTVPNTRTPPEITEAQLDGLLALTERPFRRAA